MPLVSIILPVYNGETFIKDTLTMLCQTSFEDIEIIVVDDESKDNSLEICQSFAQTDDRVRVFHKENEGGVYASRNYGMLKAEGQYICFCDQDDWVEPDIYGTLYRAAEKNAADVVMCSTGKLVGAHKQGFEDLSDVITSDRIEINGFLLSNIFMNTSIYKDTKDYVGNTIWKCMLRRTFVEENHIRFRRYINYEDDWLFLLDVMARAGTVVTLSNVLYYWRINLKSETYTTKYVDNMYEKGKTVQNEIEKILNIACIEKQYLEQFHQHYNCIRYIDLLENELRVTGKPLKEKLKDFKLACAENDFKDSLEIRKRYHKNLFRKKVALALLNMGQIRLAYIFLFVFQKVKLRGMRSHYWINLEEKLAKGC